MFETFAFWPNIVHVAAILYLICFLFRDQILLRSFAIAGDVAYTAFYFGATSQPLWQAMFWSSLNIVINLVMIGLILWENRATSFSLDERALFDRLGTVSPKHFRKFIALASWHVAETPQTLIEVGTHPDRLFYVLSGTMTGEMGGRTFTAPYTAFLGEVAFLRDSAAVGTSKIAAGSRYVSWPVAPLRRLLSTNEDLRNDIQNALLMEVLTKFSNSGPGAHIESPGRAT